MGICDVNIAIAQPERKSYLERYQPVFGELLGRSQRERALGADGGVGARIAAMTRAPRVYVRMAGWKLTRWGLLFYLAMLLADAAVVVAVAGG